MSRYGEGGDLDSSGMAGSDIDPVLTPGMTRNNLMPGEGGEQSWLEWGIGDSLGDLWAKGLNAGADLIRAAGEGVTSIVGAAGAAGTSVIGAAGAAAADSGAGVRDALGGSAKDATSATWAISGTIVVGILAGLALWFL